MRLDTYSFRNHLIAELEKKHTGATVHLDDGDVLLISLRSQELIEIHIIERAIEMEEINATFERNRQAGLSTLYLMWCDMVLPEHLQIYEPDEWLLTLHTIYNQKVYGYKVYGSEGMIYPIHLEKVTRLKRRAHYGEPITIANIGCAINQVHSPTLDGEWLIVDFQETPLSEGYQRTYRTYDDRHRFQHHNVHLDSYYIELGLELDADRNAIKKAYRQLARAYHPDVNTTPEATLKMQKINEAYTKIMEFFDEKAS